MVFTMILIRNGPLQYPLKYLLQKKNLYYFVRTLDTFDEISQFFIFLNFFSPPPRDFPQNLGRFSTWSILSPLMVRKICIKSLKWDIKNNSGSPHPSRSGVEKSGVRPSTHPPDKKYPPHSWALNLIFACCFS